MREIRVSDNCVWYPDGDVNGEPHAATVLKIIRDGVVNLNVHLPNGMRHQRNVHHVDHPDLKRNEKLRMNYGGWDFPGAAEERRQEQEERERERIQRREQEEQRQAEQAVKNRIIELHEQGADASTIAARVGGGLSHQKVNAIIRQHEESQKEQQKEQPKGQESSKQPAGAGASA